MCFRNRETLRSRPVTRTHAVCLQTGVTMITPAFELSQDPNFLTITINVPYARVCEVDLYIDGEDFKFHAKPYFLRLTLPGRIVEDGREKASYSTDKGIFTIRVPKETPGQHFEGLDMLTALLAPKGSKSAKPLVEELGASSIYQEDEAAEEGEEEEEEEEFFDWQIEQIPFQDLPEHSLSSQFGYGFGNLRSGVFTRLQEELNDVIDLKNPDSTPPAERTKKRLAAEEAKFDPDHYLADLFDYGIIQQVLNYKPWWDDLYKMAMKGIDHHEHDRQETLVSFSEEEKQQLRTFANRSYLLDKRACHQVYLSLVDIILAYAYEIRITEGEKNVESSWNIRKLNGTLSWFETYNCLQDVLVSFGRRVLCYPLYRHFKLATKSVQDAEKIFLLGRTSVLKCLLDIHKIFQENDPAYILNDLYITDYCIWIQKARPRKLTSLAASLQKAKLTKSDVGFELEELEHAAVLVQDEQNEPQQASCVARQQQTSSESKTDDSEESSSSSLSGTEESDSDEKELRLPDEDAEIKEQALKPKNKPSRTAAEEEKSTLIVASSAMNEKKQTATLDINNEKSEIPSSPSVSRKLIEELGEQQHSVTGLLQPPEATGNYKAPQDKQESHSFETEAQSEQPEATAPQGHFLEVSPMRNPLLLIAESDEAEDFS